MNMDENDFKKNHKEILRGEKNICVYWIDDCFTNSNDEKGYIPFIQLGEFDPGKNTFEEGRADKELNSDRTAYGDNGAIYLDLKNSCGKMKIGFHLCSFEYAEERWREIDKINHLILMDIGYTGKSDPNYGITLYNKMTKENPKKARFCFLSGWPERVNRVFTEAGDEHQPITFAKATGSSGTVALFDTPQNSEHTYFDIQVKTLIDKKSKDLSSLDVAQWTSLRNKVFNISFEYGKNKLNRGTPYYDWVHHLPGGGQEADKISQYSEGFEQLKKCNDAVSLEPLNLPDYFWGITDKRWKYPPVRALGQFDDCGRDLTRFFYHLGECCRDKVEHKIRFNFTYPAGAMKHDYLWFNCVALGEGLITLAEGFSQDFKDKTGDIFWSVNELLDEECGLEIIVRQYVHLQFDENSVDEKRNLRGDPSKIEPNGRIPARDDSKGRVKSAYDYFERAGAQHIHIGLQDYEYDLRLFIPAEKSPNGHFWQVKKGA